MVQRTSFDSLAWLIPCGWRKASERAFHRAKKRADFFGHKLAGPRWMVQPREDFFADCRRCGAQVYLEARSRRIFRWTLRWFRLSGVALDRRCPRQPLRNVEPLTPRPRATPEKFE